MSNRKIYAPLLVFVIFVTLLAPAEPRHTRKKSHRAYKHRRPYYYELACLETQYQDLCIRYFSRYPNASEIKNSQQLAQAALSVSLYRTLFTRTYLVEVAKELKEVQARDYQLVKDCLDQVNAGVDQLGRSIKELRRCSGASSGYNEQVFWHVSNVDTWVSATLTGASYCVDEFPNRHMSKLKATIKVRMLNVAEVTSNALALFHSYAARYLNANFVKTNKP